MNRSWTRHEYVDEQVMTSCEQVENKSKISHEQVDEHVMNNS